MSMEARDPQAALLGSQILQNIEKGANIIDKKNKNIRNYTNIDERMLGIPTHGFEEHGEMIMSINEFNQVKE